MKNIKLTMLIAVVFLAFNCSTEEVNNPVEESSAIEQNATRGGGGNSSGNTTIYIKWVPNYPEHKKQGLRDTWSNLISWDECTSNVGGTQINSSSEVWTLSPCNICHLNATPPEDDDGVERSTYGGTCPQ